MKTKVGIANSIKALMLAVGLLFLMAPLAEAGVVNVTLEAKVAKVKVAPGVHMRAWTFNGTVPGPVVRATVGDTVNVTVKNSHMGKMRDCSKLKGKKLNRCLRFNHENMAMQHSVDFHAAEVAPNLAFRNVAPGTSFTYSFTPTRPGVYMYHCGTGPMLEHLGRGMQGMIVIDPAVPRPPAQEVFLIQSEYYGKVSKGMLHTSYQAMQKSEPKYVVFNGRASRYALNPISVDMSQPLRIYFVNSGPSRFSAFHVVGDIFDSFEHDGFPGEPIHNVSTQVVGPGGGGVFEITFGEAGVYPFVTHSVIDMDRGAMGMFGGS